MNHAATGLPFAFGGPVGAGRLRVEPEDFQVRELPVCEPEGAGEHAWLWVRKRNANTEWVARQLARHAGVTPREVSFAGLKDRHAVTEQWFSVHLPGQPDPDWAGARIEGVEILHTARHGRKLKRGALRGNAFVIRIRALSGARAEIDARLAEIALRGMPNYFGEQRFGHAGGNLEAARAMLDGRTRPPRHLRGLYLSALRSFLFNQVLAARVADGSWERALPGEVLQLDGRRAWFPADPADAELVPRLTALAIHPTGPLWGRGTLATQADARHCETETLAPFANLCAGLERAGLEQDRRALRVAVRDLHGDWTPDGDLHIRFTLPAGSYATALLREIICAEAGADEDEEGT
ncbi:MAG: tRNA pseudouridine(13) synthase TruD [Gammaproteobacteria bacterium]